MFGIAVGANGGEDDRARFVQLRFWIGALVCLVIIAIAGADELGTMADLDSVFNDFCSVIDFRL